MTRDPAAAARARKAEAKADGVISIQLGAGGAGGAGGGGGGGAGTTGSGGAGAGGVKKGGFKKSGFKSAFAPVGGEQDKVEVKKEAAAAAEEDKVKSVVLSGSIESDTEDEGYEVYDPRFPTD